MGSSFQATIGILGGTGPAATAHAFMRLITICQNDYKAVQDSDYPNIIVTSIPIKDMNEFGFEPTNLIKKQLKHQLQLSSTALKEAGVDIVYMACNTLHGYQDVLTNMGLGEINILRITADYMADQYPDSTIAVLSSRSTHREKLYETVLSQKGLLAKDIGDEIQQAIDILILNAMGGNEFDNSRIKLSALCNQLLLDVDYVILGCTELSLLANQIDIESGRIIDAQEITLRELLRRSL